MLSATYATPCPIPVCYQWHMPSHCLSLCAISDICHAIAYPCTLSATYATPCPIPVCRSLGYLCVLSATYQFQFRRPIQHRYKHFYTAFDDVMRWEWGCECCCFQFCGVWTKFLFKNWPFYGQLGHKYDRACIWDGIVYHFINFRKVWTLKSKF